MPRPKSDPKTDALRQQGCLHPHPEKVTDEALRRERVLRPARPGAGQVRDAAPGPRGRAVGQPERGELRAVATVVLPGADGLRGGRPAGAAAQEARTAAGPQAVRGGGGGAARGAGGAAGAEPTGARASWSRSASASRCTGAASSERWRGRKKNAGDEQADPTPSDERAERVGARGPLRGAPQSRAWNVTPRRPATGWSCCCARALRPGWTRGPGCRRRRRGQRRTSSPRPLRPCRTDASAEVVRVLAAMTLGHIQEVHA